jgi:hypothetical protein
MVLPKVPVNSTKALPSVDGGCIQVVLIKTWTAWFHSARRLRSLPSRLANRLEAETFFPSVGVAPLVLPPRLPRRRCLRFFVVDMVFYCFFQKSVWVVDVQRNVEQRLEFEKSSLDSRLFPGFADDTFGPQTKSGKK